MFCTRCETDEHRTIDSAKCETFQDQPKSIVFKSDDDPKSNFYVSNKKIMCTVVNGLQQSTPTSGKKDGPRVHRSCPGNHKYGESGTCI